MNCINDDNKREKKDKKKTSLRLIKALIMILLLE